MERLVNRAGGERNIERQGEGLCGGVQPNRRRGLTVSVQTATGCALSLLLAACSSTGDETETPASSPTSETPTASVESPTAAGETPTARPETPTAQPETPTAQPETPTMAPTPTPPPANPWHVSAHPCVGNRTDTLWFDDPKTAWVGCGSTTSGYGIYMTKDGGKTWARPATDISGFLDAWRVNTISRSADGKLYVGGTVSGKDYRVVSLDTSVSPAVIGEEYTATTSKFQVGTFRRASDGQAFAESYTGTEAVYRATDEDTFVAANDWYSPDSSHQMLDMTLYEDKFYGCGSTISEPPYAFLPAKSGSKPYSFTSVPLATGLSEYNGEMWGIDVDVDGIVIGGVDQDRDVGKIYISQADPYTTAGWKSYDLATLFPADATWIRGVCRGEGRIVAVGEYSKKGTGMVLVSDDGGVTFNDMTPPSVSPDQVPALHRCVMLTNGDFGVAGADGYFGIYHE